MADSRSLLEALRLSHDPFAMPEESFFAAGDRTRQLDELRQLSRGVRRLLVVTGERGIGKSVLFRALSRRLDPAAKAARINANLVNDLAGVSTAVLQGLGVAPPERDKPDAHAAAIVDHARAQTEAGRYCVIMVDDAHLLELRALELLLRMLLATTQRGLRMVFFAEPRFVKSLEKAAQRVAEGLTWHEVRLTPFSRDEMRRYLRFRFAEAGWDDHVPFTELQIQELIVDSGGVPGTLDRLASELLAGPAEGTPVGVFPPLHRAALLLLLVVVGMGWFVWSHRGGAPVVPEEVVDEGEPATPLDAGADARQATTRVGALRPPDAAARGVVEREATVMLPSADDASADQDHAAPDDDDLSLTESDAVETWDGAGSPAELRAPEQGQADVEQGAAAEPLGNGALRGAAHVAEPAAIAPAAPAEPESRELATLSTATPAAPPEAAEPAPARAELRAGAKDTGWVMRQAPDRYTLQLLGTADRERIVAYVNGQADIDEFALVTLQRDGQPWYIVIYGVFTSPSAARTAARNLPRSIGAVDPWVRMFEAVQKEIRKLS